MRETPTPPPAGPEFEGDYRPAAPPAHLDRRTSALNPPIWRYFMHITDALNTTLDLQTLLNRTSELVRAIFPTASSPYSL